MFLVQYHERLFAGSQGLGYFAVTCEIHELIIALVWTASLMQNLDKTGLFGRDLYNVAGQIIA